MVKQDFTVGIVDDGLLHDRGTDDVIHLLGYHYGLAEILSDRLEKVFDVLTHIGGHQGLPTFLY